MARMQGLVLPSGNRGLLVIAALAGLAAAVLFVVAVNGNGSTIRAGETAGTGNTVAAVKNIGKGQKIETGMVGIKTAPKDLLIPGALDDPAKVVGILVVASRLRRQESMYRPPPTADLLAGLSAERLRQASRSKKVRQSEAICMPATA